jgi:stage III sporulation protein SpoIIIAA
VAELDKLFRLLPPELRAAAEAHPSRYSLLELVLDLGRTPLARFPSGDVPLAATPLSRAQLDAAVAACGDFGGDNRAGIDRTLHRVSAIRNRAGAVVGLTARAGRSIAGSAELIRDIAVAGASVLLLGRPGVGKTTAIRELARILADDACRRVVIVDTSNEIGGDGDVPHPGVGGARRMQMHTPDAQHRVLIEAVENHMPQTIVVDEIGTLLEADAARTIAQRGVQLIATAHGHALANVLKNPSLVGLVGGVESVTLGDEEARRRGVSKSVLERQGPPTFNVAVEMLAIGRWRVHLDVAAAVDALLAGNTPVTQLRYCGPDGAVMVQEDYGGGAEGDMATCGALLMGDAGLASSMGGMSASAAAGAPQLGMSGRSAASGSAAGQRGGTGAPSGGGTPAVRLFCNGIDTEALARVVAALGMQAAVVVTPALEEADAVLTLRSRLGRTGSDDWLRLTARQRGLPLYAIKTDTLAQLVRALKAILGVPAGAADAAAMEDALAAAEGGSGARGSGRSGGGAAGGGSVASASSVDAADALEEARLAVEQIVIPRNTPVELLPRAPHIRAAQEALVASYRLTTATAGVGAAARLRILPDYAPPPPREAPGKQA